MTLDVDCRMSTFPRSNEKSLLLSDQENESLFNVLGKGCVTLATAVVQLFLADSVNKHAWNMRSYGVVCFVKDSPKRSFFLRVYDVLTLKKSWEQEIYFQFKYNTPREFFHTFEADDCQAGLNFASVDEAGIFKATVQRKLQERLERRIQKRKTREAGNRNAQPKHGNKILNSGPLPSSGNVPLNKNVISKAKSPDKAKEKGKKKLTKADISTPTEFRHVGHAGWDPNSGLQTDNLDPEMRVLFEEMGITHSQVDEDTVNFIYDFVDKHGGLNALREDIAKRKPPPVPPPSTDHLSGSHAGKASPLPPRPNFAAPKPPSREPKPPPPPDRSAKRSALPPLPPSRDGHHSGGPSRGIPPPPPNIPPPLPSPPPAFDAPPPPPVKPSGESRAPPPSSGRACLLDAIVNFKGSALKPVEPDQEDKPVTSSSEAPGGITAALMAALDIRNTAVQYSDDEDENSDDLDDDDDEWDD